MKTENLSSENVNANGVNTLLGNVFIAKFMGAHENHQHRWYNVRPKDNGYRMADNFEYHKDWNWLMDVIEKIESINKKGDWYGDFVVTIRDNNCMIYRRGGEEIVCKYGDLSGKENKLNTTYLAVLEFIEKHGLNVA